MRKLPRWNIDAAEDLLLKCARLVDLIGPEAQPLLDRAEIEYNRLRQPSAGDRVRAMLAEHKAEAGHGPA